MSIRMTKNASEIRPGHIAIVEFNGTSQKGFYPELTKFVVLDKNLNWKRYDGTYVCRIEKRYTKNYDVFYVARPYFKLPDMDELFPESMGSELERKMMIRFYLQVVGKLAIPMSNLTFRVIKLYMNGEIRDDLFTTAYAKKVYSVLESKWTPLMDTAETNSILRRYGVHKLVHHFCQFIFSESERGHWSTVQRLISLCFGPVECTKRGIFFEEVGVTLYSNMEVRLKTNKTTDTVVYSMDRLTSDTRNSINGLIAAYGETEITNNFRYWIIPQLWIPFVGDPEKRLVNK